MSAITKKMHELPFERAQQRVKMCEESNPAPELLAAYNEALASHPGNPANAGKSSSNGRQESPEAKAAREAKTSERLAARAEVLRAWKANEITDDEMETQLAALDRPRGVLYCKVSEKGGMSVYGLQRMPVTLYVEQWERLLDFIDEIRAFLKEHDAEFTRKAAK